MKKFLSLALVLSMFLAVAGCGKTGISHANSWAEDDDTVTCQEYDDGTFYYEGRMDSNMKTAWFDFKITDAYYTDEALGGYTPSNGNVLVVVEMTIKNTFSESIPMSNWDFQLQWGDDDDPDTFAFPVETNEDLLDDQFPAEYDLKVNEKKEGVLIFEAPEGVEDFSIAFVEYYEDDTEGDGFWVYFSADEK